MLYFNTNVGATLLKGNPRFSGDDLVEQVEDR